MGMGVKLTRRLRHYLLRHAPREVGREAGHEMAVPRLLDTVLPGVHDAGRLALRERERGGDAPHRPAAALEEAAEEPGEGPPDGRSPSPGEARQAAPDVADQTVCPGEFLLELETLQRAEPLFTEDVAEFLDATELPKVTVESAEQPPTELEGETAPEGEPEEPLEEVLYLLRVEVGEGLRDFVDEREHLVRERHEEGLHLHAQGLSEVPQL